MMAYKLSGLFSILILTFISSYANAIQLSSLAEIANKDGEAVFTVKNNDVNRIFLNVTMSEITVVDGEVKKKPYNRDNINEWKIHVRPAKTIIEPGFEKDIRVSFDCKGQCDITKDHVFQLSFVPTPYFAEDKRPAQAVQMAIGFSAIFFAPGEETKPQYKAEYDGKQVRIVNTGQHLFKAILNTCNADKASASACKKTVFVLAGRELTISLPDTMVGFNTIELETTSANGAFEDKTILNKVIK